MPRFDDYYEPRDWRSDLPRTQRERLTCAFRRKAHDKLFQLAGYDTYQSQLTTQYGWWDRHTWTDEQRKSYERWWVQQFVNEFRTSIKRADSEFAAFIYVYAWADRKPEPVASRSRTQRTGKARAILLDYPGLS
jgi:hypothetical protein